MAKPTKQPNRAEIIDELGKLDADLAASGIAAKLKRVEYLRKTVRAWAENEPAEKPCLFDGDKYAVTLTPREKKRSITSLTVVSKAMGIKTFLAKCTLTLTAVEEFFGAEADKYITEAQSGTRTVATFERRAA
jgi:hypothetical protein